MSHDPDSPLNPNKPAVNHNTPSIVFFIFLTQLFLLFPWQKVMASGKECNECLAQNFTWHQGQWLCNKCFTIYTEQAFKTLPPLKKNTITSALDTLTQQVSKMSLTKKVGTVAAATVVIFSAYTGHIEITASIGTILVAKECIKAKYFPVKDEITKENQDNLKMEHLPSFLAAREFLNRIEDKPSQIYAGDPNTVLATFKSCLDREISASKEVIELCLVFHWANAPPQDFLDRFTNFADDRVLLEMARVEQEEYPPDISALRYVIAKKLEKNQKELFDAINNAEHKDAAQQAVTSFLATSMKAGQTFALFLKKLGIFGIHMTAEGSFYLYDPLVAKIFLFDGATPKDRIITYVKAMFEHSGDIIKLYKTPKP